MATDTDEFGACPECDGNDGFLNIGRHHWFRCDTHKIKWWGGSNLFSYWREESPELHEENRVKLDGYRVITKAA